jgi:hypothetical protein
MAGVSVLTVTVMSRLLMVRHRASRRTGGPPVSRHRPQPVHVAPETLRAAEPRLAQKGQEDEHTAEANQEG